MEEQPGAFARTRSKLGLVAALLVGLVVGTVPATAEIGSGDRPVTVTVTPKRILDTRGTPNGPIGVGVAGPLGPQQVLNLKVAGVAPVPDDAVGAVLNVTTVNSSAASFVTLYPADKPRPNASTVNPAPGDIAFNAAVVDLSPSGEIGIYNNSGSTDVVVDVTGYTVSHNHDDRYLKKTDPHVSEIEVIETVETRDALATGNEMSVVMTCPDGTEPIAGGVDYFPTRHVRVTDSFPTTVTVPGPSWVVRLYNGSGATHDVTATGYATCAG